MVKFSSKIKIYPYVAGGRYKKLSGANEDGQGHSLRNFHNMAGQRCSVESNFQ